jgi:hypothetical protein
MGYCSIYRKCWRRKEEVGERRGDGRGERREEEEERLIITAEGRGEEVGSARSGEP